MLSKDRNHGNNTFNIISSLSWKKEKRSRRTQFQFTGRHNEKNGVLSCFDWRILYNRLWWQSLERIKTGANVMDIVKNYSGNAIAEMKWSW